MLRLRWLSLSTIKRIQKNLLLQKNLTMSCSPVFVYQGLGVDERCLNILYKSLLDNVDSRKYSVSFIKPSEIREGLLQASGAALLAIGGGYDLGFLKALGPEGVAQIGRYVRGGGAYLGICAGGYFACDCIAFDKGGPLEVCGQRDLKFFPGLCEGPAFPGFQYQSEVGAFASELSFTSPDPDVQLQFHAYFNGGGKFLFHNPPLPSPTTDSEHFHNKSAAAFSQGVAKRNGFVQDVLGPNHASVAVASMHCDSKTRESPLEDCKACWQTETLSEKQSTSVERHLRNSSVVVLATYSELKDKPAAIVKSCVGSGTAVLSGAHIEFDVGSLPVDDVYIDRIREKLEAGENARTDCFRCCLQHLNLCLK